MANGKAHDRFNLILGAVSCGVMIGLQFSWFFVLAFFVGLFISTMILSPDIDLMPKKRAGIFRIFLYPYSIMFKHRGISHYFLIGTLTRIIYLAIISYFIVYILHGLGHLSLSNATILYDVKKFFRGFDLAIPTYQVVFGVFIGMVFADLCHLFLDQLSSFCKRLWPF